MRMWCLIALLACKQSEPQPVELPAPVTPPAIAATPPKREQVAAVKHPAWARPAGPANVSEQALWGTWVATVGDYATHSAFMADKVMMKLDGKSQDLVTAIGDAVLDDAKIATNCVWLELNEDFTGIRRECALVNGEPSALDQNDLATGQKKDLGTRLHWYFDMTDKVVKIQFDADMLVPQLHDGKLRDLAFRQWTLKIGDKVGDNEFLVQEGFPEHDYQLPTRYKYLIAPQRFVGK